MDGYLPHSDDAANEKPWWDRRWVWLVGGIPVAVGMIVADNYGYGGLFEWAFAISMGMTVAVAAFWERRTARWFIPAIAFLAVAHFAVLASRQWQHIPSHSTGSYMAIKGVAGMDFAVSGAFLWCIHRLFDPRTGMKAHWSTTAKLVTSVFLLINLGIFGFVGLAVLNAHKEKVAQQRVVFSERTYRPMHDVLECIDPNITDNDQWRKVGRAAQTFDEFFGRTIRVVDEGTQRRIEVATVQGRPLRPKEQAMVADCVA